MLTALISNVCQDEQEIPVQLLTLRNYQNQEVGFSTFCTTSSLDNLLLDDEDLIRTYTKELFGQHGHKIETCANGIDEEVQVMLNDGGIDFLQNHLRWNLWLAFYRNCHGKKRHWGTD